MAEQFDNAAALAKLALLNPAPAELAAASAPKASGAAASGKQGKRTTAGTGSQIGAGRIGTAFEPKAKPSRSLTTVEMRELNGPLRNTAARGRRGKERVVG